MEYQIYESYDTFLLYQEFWRYQVIHSSSGCQKV